MHFTLILSRFDLLHCVIQLTASTATSVPHHSPVMPGFELTRFVDAIATAELKDLSCDICKDIFNNPVVTACCHEVYCESCIKPWIETNHTCPSDYKPLKPEGLMLPPVALTSLLNKHKVKCAFEERGCQEVEYELW